MSTALDLKLIRAADDHLDADDRVADFRGAGERLFLVFGADEGRVSTQVRNLQQIVVSARRLSDVENFIKNQMGKKSSGANEWRQVGDLLLNQLVALREKANEWTDTGEQRLHLRLHLARGWVRAVVGAYLYAKAHGEMNHA